ncbi:MAG: hypothetical protein ACHQEB_01590 [Chitinophagales bacterium]
MQPLSNSRFYNDQYYPDDMMNDLTGAIFDADIKENVNVYRQYVQTAYVQIIASIIDSRNASYDDVARAAALNTLRKINTQLTTAISSDEDTKAHRANLQFIITNALRIK